MSIQTGASNYTKHFEDGQQVFPCRCGKTHRGQYAVYDYGHHECLHIATLLLIGRDQVICPECGASWRVEEEEP